MQTKTMIGTVGRLILNLPTHLPRTVGSMYHPIPMRTWWLATARMAKVDLRTMNHQQPPKKQMDTELRQKRSVIYFACLPAELIVPWQILTPADFALMKDLQSRTDDQQNGSGTKRKFAATRSSIQAGQSDKALDEGDIVGPRKKAKATYEERMESIKQGREGRAKFGSMKGKKAKESSSSSTNREKARNKPIMMVMASGAVKSKKRASLKDKQRRLKAHNDKQKKRKS